MTEENKPIFDGILTPEARKQTEIALFGSWPVGNDLSNQVSDSIVGLSALLYAVKRADIASKLPDNAENIEHYKQQFDAIAYYIEGFVEEFKPLYDKMLDRYVAEKLAGTFDPKANQGFGVQSSSSSNHVYSYVNPIRSRGSGWDDRDKIVRE